MTRRGAERWLSGQVATAPERPAWPPGFARVEQCMRLAKGMKPLQSNGQYTRGTMAEAKLSATEAADDREPERYPGRGRK